MSIQLVCRPWPGAGGAGADNADLVDQRSEVDDQTPKPLSLPVEPTVADLKLEPWWERQSKLAQRVYASKAQSHES